MQQKFYLCVSPTLLEWPVRGPTSRRRLSVQRRIPGSYAAYAFLAASGLFVVAAFAGALWLTGEGALWLGHALPHPLL
jgi:hypothetical protein